MCRVASRLGSPARLPLLFGILATVVALAILFVPRPIGMADNGDELRLICRMGLAPDYAPEQVVFFETVNFTYSPGELPIGLNCDYHSSAEPVLRAAALVSPLLPGGHDLDLRVVGVIYALLFGVAIGFAVAGLPEKRWLRVAGGLLLVAVLGDIAFVGYFSTGYSEPMGLVGFVATVGALMHGWRKAQRGRLAWLLFVTLLAVVTMAAKPQYGTLAPILAVAVAARPIREVPARLERAFPILCGAVLLVTGAVSIGLSPAQFNHINRYNAFFTELLGHSPNPGADLREFGLPAELGRNAGLTYFEDADSEDDPHVRVFYDKVGFGDLIGFYARHPSRTAPLLARGLRAGADPRLDYLGRYPFSAHGRKLSRPCRWCFPSATGRLLRPAAPLLGPAAWLLGLAIGARELRRGDTETRALAGGLLVAMCASVVLFASAVFGEGTEFTKHLVLSIEAGWMGLCLSALLLASYVQRWRHRRGVSPPALTACDPTSGTVARSGDT